MPRNRVVGRLDGEIRWRTHQPVARRGQPCYNDALPMPKQPKRRTPGPTIDLGGGQTTRFIVDRTPAGPGTGAKSRERYERLREAASLDAYFDPSDQHDRAPGMVVQDPISRGVGISPEATARLQNVFGAPEAAAPPPARMIPAGRDVGSGVAGLESDIISGLATSFRALRNVFHNR